MSEDRYYLPEIICDHCNKVIEPMPHEYNLIILHKDCLESIKRDLIEEFIKKLKDLKYTIENLIEKWEAKLK